MGYIKEEGVYHFTRVKLEDWTSHVPDYMKIAHLIKNQVPGLR